MSLGLFAAAWTTLDQSASALTNGALSLLGKLVCDQNMSKISRELTYLVLTESEWHMSRITADLDPDRAELTEYLCDSNLESLIGL
jgi:hypothetical protein